MQWQSRLLGAVVMVPFVAVVMVATLDVSGLSDYGDIMGWEVGAKGEGEANGSAVSSGAHCCHAHGVIAPAGCRQVEAACRSGKASEAVQHHQDYANSWGSVIGASSLRQTIAWAEDHQ